MNSVIKQQLIKAAKPHVKRWLKRKGWGMSCWATFKTEATEDRITKLFRKLLDPHYRRTNSDLFCMVCQDHFKIRTCPCMALGKEAVLRKVKVLIAGWERRGL